MMIPFRKFLLATILLSLVGCATEKKVTSLDPQVDNTLGTYFGKLEYYKSQDAAFVSPDHYQEAKEVYDDAYAKAYQGESLQTVNSILVKGDMHFMKIDENLKLAQLHLKDVVNARNEALEEGAQDLDLFMDADENFTDLGENLENKDINEVIEDKAKTINMYVQAEIKAIQLRELKPAVKNFKEAKKMKSISSFAPEKEVASKDIETSLDLIAKFKDEPNRYAQSIKNAEYSTKRLLVLTQTGDWIKKNDTRDVVMRMDKDMNSILEPLAYSKTQVIPYREKVEIAIDETSAIPLIVDELSETQYQSYLQKKNVNALKQEKNAIATKLEAKKEVEKKIAKVKSMFKDEEAKVVIQGDDLVIKLVGLNFDFNKSELPQKAKPILEKVAESAESLDYPDMKIIGHSDSKGNANYNQALSKKRAESVHDYLVDNTAIDDEDTYVTGAGYRKPVSENKTSAGRKTNRRVDIVFNSVVQ